MAQNRWLKIIAAAAAVLAAAVIYLYGPGQMLTEGDTAGSGIVRGTAEDTPRETASSESAAPESGEEPGQDPSGTLAAPDTEPALVTVHVCGEVTAPGVYVLPEGSRVADAVRTAGDFTDEASRDFCNLAEVIRDGQQIRIPDRAAAETAAAAVTQAPAGAAGDVQALVNINTASREELMQLPGIGASRADDIMAYRSRTPFRTKEDIMQVPGIKEGSFAKLRDRITVR